MRCKDVEVVVRQLGTVLRDLGRDVFLYALEHLVLAKLEALYKERGER